ncbi:MAG TPA: transcriptional regulator NrdR [Kofleriaceae bacterium]|nr:transcriptional regulator NrdR [Kofleriaceae bacterium]
MRCPFCGASEDKVIETRVSKDGSEIRRRRECEGCSRRYTTYERIEESMPLVIKNDGRREPFDRAKIEHGILVAVAKRPVSRDQIAALALEVEREIGELGASELPSRDIGERVLLRLRALDQVAYVRFASIYRDFRDLEGFAKELDALRGEDTGRHEMPDLGDVDTDARPAPEEDAPREDTDRHAAPGEPARSG